MTLADWRRGGQVAPVANRRLFYRDDGEGEPLLLIHGFPTSSWDWHRLTPGLAARYRVIAPDMLGYGYSDKPADGDYSTARQVRLLCELLEQLGVREVHVMAGSYGVSVAQELLSQCADGTVRIEPRSACFVNGGLFPESNHPTLAQRALISPLGAVVNRAFTKRTLARNLRAICGPYTKPSRSLIDDYWRLLQHNDGKRRLPKLARYLTERQHFSARWREALTRGGLPISLIVGTTDAISGAAVAAQLERTVPRARVIRLAGIGHYPQLEAPQLVQRHYAQFRADPPR